MEITMSFLKYDTLRRQKLKGDLATVLGILDDIDSADAELFIKWMGRKAQLYSDAVSYKPYHNLPSDLKRGDIVLCDLGINIPPEFSDKNTGRHFVVFWAQQGHNAIVIPITKRVSDQNKYTILLGAIEGLPEKDNYIKLDAIRSVSLRRISRVAGFRNGKISGEHIIPVIKEAIIKYFVDD